MDPLPTIDVRTIKTRDHHAIVLSTLHGLAPGKSFLIVDADDPKPLFERFRAELGRPLEWEYLERGPKTWKVLVRRPD